MRVPSTGKPRLSKIDAVEHVRDFSSLPLQFHEPAAEEEVASWNSPSITPEATTT